MDVQHALLSKVINDEAIARAVNARITPEFFTDDKWRRVYEHCLEHWRNFGTPPDADVIANAFPSYTFQPYRQSFDYFVDALRQRRKRVILTDALSMAAGFYDATDDPDSLDNIEVALREALTKVRLETAPTYDVSLVDDYGHVLDRLDERSLDPTWLRGISTGFPGIDYVTGGLQPEQFVVIIGLPKSLKSSTLLYIAKFIHHQGKMPLFIGFEMTNDEQEDRLVSMYSGVGLTKVLNGTFSIRERRDIERSLRMLKETSLNQFILSVDMDLAMTVGGVQAKILEYNPDVVLIDGAYLMQSEMPKVEQGSSQALSNVARELKKLAQSQHIAIVATTQASEARARGGKLNAGSGMYAQAWRQSADVLLGTERVYGDDDYEEEASGVITVRFKVLASRAGPRTETVLEWNWNNGEVTEVTAVRGAGNGDD